MTFPVECTPFASTLLNSVPIVESDKREQFEFADFSLLWFTTETKEECEKVLESYEEKLHLFSNYVVRNQLLEELMKKYSTDQYLITKLQEIQQIDEEEF